MRFLEHRTVYGQQAKTTASNAFCGEQVCTKLARGGPNNATYIVGYTILDREHTATVGIESLGTQLSGDEPLLAQIAPHHFCMKKVKRRT
jgi:hypothetical protein